MTVHRKRGQQKVAPTWEGFAAAKKGPNKVLLSDIKEHLVSKALKEGNADRERHLIHVSDLVRGDWCPRQAAYKISGAPVTDDDDSSVSARMESIYASGNAAHSKWQTWLWEMGRMWGTWRCAACGATWRGLSPKECERCGSKALEYREVGLYVPELFLVGHGDGAVPDLGAIVEVKTIGTGTVRLDDLSLLKRHTVKTAGGKAVVDLDGLWSDIHRPFRTHLLQTMVYLWMCRQMGGDMGRYDRVVFLYEYKANQDSKEFVVRYSDTLIKPILDRLAETVRKVQNGGLPDRPFKRDSATCRHCEFRTLCWERDEEEDKGQGRGRGVRPRRRIVGREKAA